MKKLVLAVPLILIFGCKKPGPLYCETHADCAKWGLDFCDVNGEYPASEGIAPTCINNPFDAGTGDAGLGDGGGDDTDTSCTDHSECASEVCDKVGNTCAEAAAIVYVDGEAGEDNVGCGGSDSPCKSMSFGVLQVVGERQFMHVQPGTYVDNAVTITGRRVHIIATGVKLFPVAARSVVKVEGASNVTIDGLELSGYMLECVEDSTLGLRSVSISNLDGVNYGIFVENCPAIIEDTTISNIREVGIEGSGFTLRRSVLTGNTIGFTGSGDVQIEQTVISNNLLGVEYYGGSSGTERLVLRNNIITGNDAAFGVHVGANEAVIEHNTITGNTADSSSLSCSASVDGAVRMVGNIIYDNTAAANISDGCSITYSNIEGGAPGTGNIDVDPEFLAGDYHLKESSPCVDRVPSEVTVDIDGEARPGGGMNDMGADEVL